MLKQSTLTLGILLLAGVLVAGTLLFYGQVSLSTQGASAAQQPAVTIAGVSPTTAPNNLDTTVSIHGTGFSAEVSGTIVITPPQVTLGEVLLPGVAWVNTTTLTATVPWGLDAGTYTLTVTNPDGMPASLSSAFTVTQALNVWTTGGPYGGTVWDIAVSPVQTETVFAVVAFAGLYQSHDAGGTWEHTSLGAGDRFSHVSYGAASPDTLFACGPIGLWASQDHGVTWQPIYGQDIITFAQHPVDPDILYISRWDEGILRSEDGGHTWENRSQGIDLLRVRRILIDPSNPATLYATTDESGLYKSTDEGLLWLPADTGLGDQVDTSYTLAQNPFEPDTLWAMGKQLYRSNDAALSWFPVSIPYEVPWAIAYNPVVSGTLYAGSGHDLLVSRDGGDTWERYSQTFFDGMIYQIRLDPATGQPMYLGNNGGGFYHSADQGHTWVQAVEGLAGVEPRAVVPAPSDPTYVYYMTVDGVFYSNNSGQSWVKSKGGETHTVAVDPDDPLVAYGAQWGPGLIAKTTDGGQGWSPILVTSDTTRYISAFSIYPTDTQRVLAGGGNHWADFANSRGWLALSADGGDTWQEITITHAISEVTSILIDPLAPSTLYLGTCTIHPYWNHGSDSGVYKSTDGGITWNPANNGMDYRCVRDLVMHPENSQVLFAAINDPTEGAVGIYKSVDGGASWTTANTGLETSMVLEIAIDPLQPSHLYAATWRGLFYSLNSGLTWQRASAPFGSVPVFSVAAAGMGERTFLYIGTAGGEPEVGGVVSSSDSSSSNILEGFVHPGVYQTTLAHRQESPIYLPMVGK